MAKKKGALVLESGKIFTGSSFGKEGTQYGEIVFNTSLSGYQEILTDPSYCGQIVCMTYPHIGNYGINLEDMESRKPFVSGFVIKELSPIASNWRSTESLESYLKSNNVIAIEGIDTRALTMHIRKAGAMKAMITTKIEDPKKMISKVKKSQGLIGRDLVKEVILKDKYVYNKEVRNFSYRVAVLDCGCKMSILREFEKRNCEIMVYPATASREEIMSFNPHGIFLTNGPGDPAAVTYVIETVKQIIGKPATSKKRVPVFGICLGHQMLGLALGAKTYKLKFGHRGANHPVKDMITGKIEITSQNHGFCVRPETLPKKDVEITHINLYDKTLEGIKHKKLPVFSVQYHPEAGPGPHDSKYLFDRFTDMMDKYKKQDKNNA